MAINMQEILGKNVKIEDQPQNIQSNLATLLDKVNKLRALYGKPLIVTSGLRTMAQHLAIYAQKGITDKTKIPMKSNHLFGSAVDFSDPDLSITKWLKDNPKVLEDCGLFCEEGNSNWVHCQSVPFGSYKKGGTRWFRP